MSFFLEEVSKSILKDAGAQLGRCCIAVPNRRTGLYLSKYLREHTEATVFAPDIFTIDELGSLISGLEQADTLSLLIQLFDVFRKNRQPDEDALLFDDFVSWGTMLLADFNDIDAALANADDVFGYLSEAKAITLWNPGQPHLSSFQKKYLAFYKSLGNYYNAFSQELLTSQKAYQGLMFRHIATQKLYEPFAERWHRVYFVGFNVFTKAEELLADFFITACKGRIYFDYDTYYTQNLSSEAGSHVRRNIRKWGQGAANCGIEQFAESTKKIEIIGVPMHVGQAKICGTILMKTGINDLPNDTAVVLPKEDLLFPVLNSIPENIAHANITMGYPMYKTQIFGFFDAIISLFENARRLQALRHENELKLHIKDLLKVFDNPFLNLILDVTTATTQEHPLKELRYHLKKSGMLFYTPFRLGEICRKHVPEQSLAGKLCALLAGTEATGISVLNNLVVNCVSLVLNSDYIASGKYDTGIDAEFLHHYKELTDKLSLFMTHVTDAEVRSFRSLHKMLVKALSVPFTGEPLAGLQIMGLLETRNLDFKNVIMLSVNEGIIPGNKSQNSFIPPDIRKHYGLQVHYDNESVFAYHFFRLLQRAENIYLVYNTEPDVTGSGERSRFITQLFHELPSYNPNITIEEKLISAPLTTTQTDESISIDKTPDVMALIRERLERGVSPSSLGIYLQCPLRFYFEYLLGVDVPEEQGEHMDAAEFGTVIHDVLEQIFKPLCGQELSDEAVTISEETISALLNQAFEKNFSFIDTATGKNHLLYRMAHKYIMNFLKSEKTLIANLKSEGKSIFIEDTEMKYEKTISLKTAEGDFTINLNGRIDRTDRVNNMLRVIDYKTGSIEDKDLKFGSWEEVEDGLVPVKIVQLLVYSYLCADYYKNLNFVCGFISLRKPDKGLLDLTFPDGMEVYDSTVYEATDKLLKNVFAGMCDSTKPITQTPTPENCIYCDFRTICNR